MMGPPIKGLGLLSKEDFFVFIQLENFRRPGRPEYLAYRSRAAAVLAYCAGLSFPEVMRLRSEHWMPDEEACLIVEANAERARRRVPASPATQWAVQRFLVERPPPIGNAPLFACERGLPLKQEIANAIRKSSFARETKPRSGELRASFEEAILKYHRDSPLSYYLIGAAPPGHLPYVLDDPPLEDLHRLLRKSGHLYFDREELWRHS
jgi:site-specific recombinase XerC